MSWPTTHNHDTHVVVVMLLAERKVELRVFRISLFELGLKKDHHAVLQEVVIRQGVRVETLRFVVMQPNNQISSVSDVK